MIGQISVNDFPPALGGKLPLAWSALSHDDTDLDLACSPLLDGVHYSEECRACCGNSADPIQGVLIAKALCHFDLLMRHFKESLGDCQTTLDLNELLTSIWCPANMYCPCTKLMRVTHRGGHNRAQVSSQNACRSMLGCICITICPD